MCLVKRYISQNCALAAKRAEIRHMLHCTKLKPGDPELNPWLPVRRTVRFGGFDAYGLPKVEFSDVEFRPSYYFWLGERAYEPWPILSVGID